MMAGAGIHFNLLTDRYEFDLIQYGSDMSQWWTFESGATKRNGCPQARYSNAPNVWNKAPVWANYIVRTSLGDFVYLSTRTPGEDGKAQYLETTVIHPFSVKHGWHTARVVWERTHDRSELAMRIVNLNEIITLAEKQRDELMLELSVVV